MTSYTDEQVPKVVLTAPERIYLQVSDQEWDSDKPFPGDCDGVSWWKESVLDVEVQYVRADLFEALEADRTRLQAEVRALRLCAIQYLTWHHVVNPVEGLDSDLRDPDMCGDAALKSESIDSARAKKGDA
ncbi:hypothetical protein FHW84_002527 [Dyella sp. SG562]|uniref:hypothetical protein n=1 Tax=Dyella sp. SG562 TaxID=2587017 RepID=UPI0014248307|nr:hypothetical protein [Dyella sp. SG562]NII73954.1 hypothetical protein [Dyella sp. SG562]